MKLKRNKKLLKLVCRDVDDDNINFKYNWHIAKEDVPTTLIQAALAFLDLDKERLKEIVDMVCEDVEEKE